MLCHLCSFSFFPAFHSCTSPRMTRNRNCHLPLDTIYIAISLYHCSFSFVPAFHPCKIPRMTRTHNCHLSLDTLLFLFHLPMLCHHYCSVSFFSGCPSCMYSRMSMIPRSCRSRHHHLCSHLQAAS